MKITLLGTGTPAPSLKRQSSGYLVEVGGDLIIMGIPQQTSLLFHRIFDKELHPNGLV
jgi:ribonuclease Z